MPLAWAHAEFIKAATVGQRGRAIETLAAVTAELAAESARPTWHWRTDVPFASVPAGRDVLIDVDRPFTVEVSGVAHRAVPVGLGRYAVRFDASAPLGEVTVTVDASLEDPIVATIERAL